MCSEKTRNACYFVLRMISVRSEHENCNWEMERNRLYISVRLRVNVYREWSQKVCGHLNHTLKCMNITLDIDTSAI